MTHVHAAAGDSVFVFGRSVLRSPGCSGVLDLCGEFSVVVVLRDGLPDCEVCVRVGATEWAIVRGENTIPLGLVRRPKAVECEPSEQLRVSCEVFTDAEAPDCGACGTTMVGQNIGDVSRWLCINCGAVRARERTE